MHLIILIFLTFSGILFHPVHVSITNINFDSELNAIEVSFQFFNDDFKNTVLINTGIQVILKENQEPDEECIKAINKYILSNFGIIINNENKMNFNFHSLKKNEESIWLYYRSGNLNDIINNIHIENTLMLDVFPDQKNLLILDINGKARGYTFNFRTNTINTDL